MTANQINLAKVREEARHNRVSERHEHEDVASRRLSANASYLTAQAQDRNATTNWWAAKEQGRHNLETERVSAYSADALASFQLKQGEALLRQAAVAEREADTRVREALVKERQASVAERDLANRYRSSVAQQTQAEVAKQNTQIRRDELAASILANQRQVALGYSQLAESKRHAQAVESETMRANMATEGINATRNEIQSRYNRQMYSLGYMNATSQRTTAEAAKQQSTAAAKNATTNERSLNLNKLKVANESALALARSFVLLH